MFDVDKSTAGFWIVCSLYSASSVFWDNLYMVREEQQNYWRELRGFPELFRRGKKDWQLDVLVTQAQLLNGPWDPFGERISTWSRLYVGKFSTGMIVYWHHDYAAVSVLHLFPFLDKFSCATDSQKRLLCRKTQNE
jgi:hypothetical protein